MSIFSMCPRTHRHVARHRLPMGVMAAIILMIGLMTGCTSRPPVSATDVLDAMCQAATDRPSGEIRYRCSTQADANAESSPFRLNDELLSALYGADCLSWFEEQSLSDGTISSPIVDEAAMYLATARHPFEIAVFRCTDSIGTLSAVKQCNKRLNAIRQSWVGTDKEDYCRPGRVEIIDNYVILVVASDPDPLLDAALKAIS